MKQVFTQQELLDFGFEKIEDGGETYFQYVFEPENYLTSNFLATSEKSNPEADCYLVEYGYGNGVFVTEAELNQMFSLRK